MDPRLVVTRVAVFWPECWAEVELAVESLALLVEEAAVASAEEEERAAAMEAAAMEVVLEAEMVVAMVAV